MADWLPQIAVIAVGLLLGSFFNVLIWRLPRDEEVVFTPSHCPACGRRIKPWENIPLLSFILLGGRCAGCRGRISVVYPLVELLTALLCLLLWRALVLPELFIDATAWHWVFLAARICTLLLLVPISVIDVRHFIIPNAFTYPGMVLGLGLSFLPGDITPLQSLLGIAAGGASLFLFGKLGEVVFRKGEAMGFGDVKLMTWAGALWGWQVMLLTILIASFAGALAGLTMMLLKRLRGDHHIPFGPFLAVGLLVSVVWGDAMVTWYLQVTERFFLP